MDIIKCTGRLIAFFPEPLKPPINKYTYSVHSRRRRMNAKFQAAEEKFGFFSLSSEARPNKLAALNKKVEIINFLLMAPEMVPM